MVVKVGMRFDKTLLINTMERKSFYIPLFKIYSGVVGLMIMIHKTGVI